MSRFAPLLCLCLSSCWIVGDLIHDPEVPVGLPFDLGVTVHRATAQEYGHARGCVLTPDTWVVEPVPDPAVNLTSIPVSEVLSAWGAGPGNKWTCFSSPAYTTVLTVAHLRLTPDMVGTWALQVVVENSDPTWTNIWDTRQTTVDVRPALPDEDGDGVDSPAFGGEDCDDTAPDVFPGALEVCDGVDQDCDSVIDNGTPDWDADGLCDAHDFRLVAAPLVSGAPADIQVLDAQEGSERRILISTRLLARPRCLPGRTTPDGAPLCYLLDRPSSLRVATGAGTDAAYRQGVPGQVAPGTVVYAQGYWSDGTTGQVTPVQTWVVQ